MEPGPGVGPHPVRRTGRDSQRLRRFGSGQPREVPKLDQPSRLGVFGGQPGECRIQREQVVAAIRGRLGDAVEGDTVPVATVLLSSLAPSGFHQDAPHGLGGGGEEVAPVVPASVIRGANQPKVGLVHESRGLEGLAGFLPSETLGGQLPQLVVDQRQELLGCLAIALLDGGQDARDVVHEVKDIVRALTGKQGAGFSGWKNQATNPNPGSTFSLVDLNHFSCPRSHDKPASQFATSPRKVLTASCRTDGFAVGLKSADTLRSDRPKPVRHSRHSP